jgi:predicted RNase H-like nuclease (RuvC/YqgF family)
VGGKKLRSDTTMSTVSKENLRKVERFFIDTIKASGNKRIEATVLEIAEGAGVALATAHKAIKELDNRGTLTVIKPASRRFPITYVYRGDIEGFEVAQSKEEQIQYLQNLNAENQETIHALEKRVKELESIINRSSIQNA